MKLLKRFIILVVILLLPYQAFSIVAFPGAQGGGANSIGGRGGTVYIIDTLSDNPVDGDTFREAAEASGARIIVFEVSGIIDLDSVLLINNPYLTIAGETSPGGILVKGWQTIIQTHDVIMRHMRFRNGCAKCNGAGNCDTAGDSLSVYGQIDGSLLAYNVIIDHCSVSWGCDETLDIASNYVRTDSITISNCLIAEGVDDAHPEPNHGLGVLIWGRNAVIDGDIEASFYRNLIMSFRGRLPMITHDAKVDFVNNVIYNFNLVNSMTMNPVTNVSGRDYEAHANFIHNYVKPGPLSYAPWSEGDTAGGREVLVWASGLGTVTGNFPDGYTPYEMIYMIGNIGYTRATQTGSEWITRYGWPTDYLSTSFRRDTPFELVGGIPITVVPMSEAYADEIVSQAGATVPMRDSVDIRLVSEYTAGDEGTYINMADVVFPTFTTPDPPVDSDSDGMADWWEIANFGDLSKTSSGDENGSGYTNIEEYFHYLAPELITVQGVTLEGVTLN